MAKSIEDKLRAEFSPSKLTVVDHSGWAIESLLVLQLVVYFSYFLTGGCPGGTLEVEIHSEKFAGKAELQRHRMVNKVIKEEIQQFHAFVLRPIPSTIKE